MSSKKSPGSALRVCNASTQCDFPPLNRVRKFHNNVNDFPKKKNNNFVKKTPLSKLNRNITFSEDLLPEIPYNLRSKSNRTTSRPSKRLPTRSSTPVKAKRILLLNNPHNNDKLFEKKEAIKLRKVIPEQYKRGNKFTLNNPDADEVDPDQVDGGVSWEQLDLNNPFGELDIDQMDLNRLLILREDESGDEETNQNLLREDNQVQVDNDQMQSDEQNDTTEDEPQPTWHHLDLNAIYGHRNLAESTSSESNENEQPVWEHLDLNKLYGITVQNQDLDESDRNDWDLPEIMNATWTGSNRQNLPIKRNLRVPIRTNRPRKPKHHLLPRQRKLIEPSIKLKFDPPLNPNIDEALQFLRDNRPMNDSLVDPEVEYFNFRLPPLKRNINDNSIEAFLKAKIDQLKRIDTQIYIKLYQACKLRRIQEIKEKILDKIERRMNEIDDLVDKNNSEEQDAFDRAHPNLSSAQRNAKWLEYLSSKKPPRMNFLDVNTRKTTQKNIRERTLVMAMTNYMANFVS